MLITRRITSSALVVMIINNNIYSLMLLQMAQLIKDPRGETIMDRSTTVGSQAVSNVIMQDEVAQLKQRVSELEKELEEVNVVPGLILNAHSSLCSIAPG